MKKEDQSQDTPVGLLNLTSTIMLEGETSQMPTKELNLYHSYNTLKIVNISDVLSQQQKSN